MAITESGGAPSAPHEHAGATFRPLSAIPIQKIWPGLDARFLHAGGLSFGIIEVAPNAVVPEHAHHNVQVGMVLSGSLALTVAGERRELGPGDTWSIGSNALHDATGGPDGAVIVETWSPERGDFAQMPESGLAEPHWPSRAKPPV